MNSEIIRSRGHFQCWSFLLGRPWLVDPLPAITSIRRPSIRRPLLAAAVRLSVVMGCALAALLATGGLTARAWSPTWTGLLLCLAVTSPLQLLQSTSRRLCYLLRREGVAAASAAVYTVVLISGLVVLSATTLCSASGLILLSGAASLAASAVGVARGCVPLSKVRAPVWKWLMKQCWHSGRWLAGSVDHTFDEQLPRLVDHSSDIWAFGKRDSPCCAGAFHAHLPSCVGDGISADTARGRSWRQ